MGKELPQAASFCFNDQKDRERARTRKQKKVNNIAH